MTRLLRQAFMIKEALLGIKNSLKHLIDLLLYDYYLSGMILKKWKKQ